MIRWCLAVVFIPQLVLARSSKPSSYSYSPNGGIPAWGIRSRGGASVKIAEDDPFAKLAVAVEDRFRILAESSSNANKLASVTTEDLEKALARLASAQSTFKGLDGAAHEAYQRTHATDEVDMSVAGRAQRSAVRIGATAEALLACELIEKVENPHLMWGIIENSNSENEERTTLSGREVLLNITAKDSEISIGGSKVSILVLFEKEYVGGAGLDHGSLDHMSPRRVGRPKGRILIILSDVISNDLVQTFKVLDRKPQIVQLSSGLLSNEVVSVLSPAYTAAGDLLQILEPTLRAHNSSAVHFVGRSLAGAIANLAATILDGTLPMPKQKTSKKSRRKSKRRREPPQIEIVKTEFGTESPSENATEPVEQPLSGLGKARSSALTLGSPPCLSSNVIAAFCTSFMFGDDIVSRTTSDSIERLCKRMRKQIAGNVVGRNMGWMTDTLSMTVSSLKSHAHGSEGEEARLSVPGRAFLVRPRRLGGICSIHEVGSMNKGGREALRAGVLWQLNDVLLSKSMMKHHNLESYIQGLDKVQLRGIDDEAD